MKSFSNFVIEKVEYDLEIRTEAKEFFDKMIKYLKQNRNHFEKTIKIQKERYDDLPAEEKDKYLIGFKLLAENFIEGYDDLKIMMVSVEREYEKGSLFIWRRLGKIYFHIFLNVLTLDDNFDKFIKRLEDKFNSTFVHEFVHYKDSKRLKMSNPKKLPYPKEPIRKNFKSNFAFDLAMNNYRDKYFTNDLEVNAFFQKIIFEFDEVFKKLSNEEKKKIQSDFKVFLRYIVNLLNEYMAPQHINDSKKTKIIKRFYKYWDEIHKKQS